MQSRSTISSQSKGEWLKITCFGAPGSATNASLSPQFYQPTKMDNLAYLISPTLPSSRRHSPYRTAGILLGGYKTSMKDEEQLQTFSDILLGLDKGRPEPLRKRFAYSQTQQIIPPKCFAETYRSNGSKRIYTIQSTRSAIPARLSIGHFGHSTLREIYSSIRIVTKRVRFRWHCSESEP